LNTRFDPELSRLAFEDRLIEFLEDPEIPLLERVRLVAIVAERIDVFFMTRVGRLKRLAASGEQKPSAPAPPKEQLDVIALEARRMMRRAYALVDELAEALAAIDVGIEDWDTLNEKERRFLRETCSNRLEGTITATVVGASRRTSAESRPVRYVAEFPHVRNLRPALVMSARERETDNECLVVVELPADLPRLVRIEKGRARRFVPLEQIIVAELPELCPDLHLGDAYLFRVTRNAHTEFDDDDDSLRDVEEEIERRPFQEVVRLEVEQQMPRAMRERLLVEFTREADDAAPELGDRDTYPVEGLLDLTALEDIAKLDLPQLKCAPLKRQPTRVDQVLQAGPGGGDALLHFPFDDFETSIERFLHDAARHPDLESMQTTIYRTDDRSDVVEALRIARSRGVAVTAVVEVKASFDERDNIDLARALEADGIRVILSPPSLKVHAKTALVTFRGDRAPKRAALIGTGNMNAVTAKSYIDLWLVTRDEDRTRELALLFEVLTGEKDPAEVRFEKLLVAPFEMRRRFLEMIEREVANARAGRPSGIRGMMNGLTDPTIMNELYRASHAGVSVDLMVRGPCLLRPATPKLSENIRVVSVAGSLLQHTRIYHFRNADDHQYFIGSADWRPRNFDVRVEVITRLTDNDHVAQADRILSETLSASDAWVLGADGVYVRAARAGCVTKERSRPPEGQGSQTKLTVIPT
jgi:polyphosphate kinase